MACHGARERRGMRPYIGYPLPSIPLEEFYRFIPKFRMAAFLFHPSPPFQAPKIHGLDAHAFGE
jgi:hypothetical protein